MLETYYAGVLAIPRNASWQRIARELTLLDAQRSQRVVAARAVPAPPKTGESTEDAAWLLPIFLCRDTTFDPYNDTTDRMQRTIECFLDVPFLRFERIDPSTASDAVLEHLIAATNTTTSLPLTAEGIAPAEERPAPRILGLHEQQQAINDLGLVVAAYGRDALEACNFAFLGGPGTGKTALAQQLTRRLDELGVTDGTDRLVKADASQLIGRYVGHTAPKTKAMVERAVGGVLYIDEAYALTESAFGAECITTLVDLLDAHRHDVVCVFAGYAEGIDRLLDANEGLRERVPYRITFPGYTDAELAQIYRLFAEARAFTVEDVPDAALEDAMARLRRQRGFAQARSVRNLFQDTLIACARRTGERVIRPEDLAWALERRLADTPRKRAVGFTAPCDSGRALAATI